MDPDVDQDPDIALARLVAERVIARLGPGAPPLRVRRVERIEVDQVLVELSARVRGASRMGAYLGTAFARPHAIAVTASQLQIHVLELTHGEPLPPCPGHVHPLDTDVVDGVACWVCPQDPDHHVEPILAGHADDGSSARRGAIPPWVP